jgi:hypothetical protein
MIDSNCGMLHKLFHSLIIILLNFINKDLQWSGISKFVHYIDDFMSAGISNDIHKTERALNKRTRMEY